MLQSALMCTQNERIKMNAFNNSAIKGAVQKQTHRPILHIKKERISQVKRSTSACGNVDVCRRRPTGGGAATWLGFLLKKRIFSFSPGKKKVDKNCKFFTV